MSKVARRPSVVNTKVRSLTSSASKSSVLKPIAENRSGASPASSIPRRGPMRGNMT